MFPWQGEGKSSVMAPVKFPVGDPQQQHQQQQQNQQQAQGVRTQWRSPSSFNQNNQSKETSNSTQQKPDNTPEIIDVDAATDEDGDGDDENNKEGNHTSHSDATPMSDAPGDEHPSFVNGESHIDGNEGEDDEDEVSEGGDIQHTVNDKNQSATATPEAASADASSSYNNISSNNVHNHHNSMPGRPLAPTAGPFLTGPPRVTTGASYPMQPGNMQHVILNINRAHYGKRLNFREQVRLFEICNKYKSTFGERSKLCEWWRNVTDEFCRDIMGPYSWHSVRRKVEQVTKQRIKQREEENQGNNSNNLSEDYYPDDLCKVVDEFIPVWTKFEASEKRRIEVRDSRAASAKKRKVSPTTRTAGMPSATPPAAVPWHAAPQRWVPQHYTAASAPPPTPTSIPPPPQFYTPPGMRMPAGYDTMFRSSTDGGPPPPPAPATPHSGASASYPQHPNFRPTLSQPQSQASPLPPQAAGAGAATTTTTAPAQQTPLPATDGAASSFRGPTESSVTSAVLETLSKLNKHLEQAAAAGTDKQAASSSPIVAALASAVAGTKPSSSSTSGEVAAAEKPSDGAERQATSEQPTDTAQTAIVNGVNNLAATSSTSTSTSTGVNDNTPKHEQAATATAVSSAALSKLKSELKEELRQELLAELQRIRESFTEKLEAMEQSQEMIMEMLRQEPGRES